MRWYRNRSRSRSSARPASVGPRRPYRLGLISLEDRVLPGDSFLALLLAHAIVPERGLLSHEASRAGTSPALAAQQHGAVSPAPSVLWEEPAAGSSAAPAVVDAFAEALFAETIPANPVLSWSDGAMLFGANRLAGLSGVNSFVTAAPSAEAAGAPVTGISDARPPVPATPLGGGFGLSSAESVLLGLVNAQGDGSGTRGPSPAAPSHLGVTAWSATQNSLIWVDNSNNEDGFRVLRSSDGFFYSPIGTVGPNVTTYNDTTPLVGLNYYQVVAFNSGGDSPVSNSLRIDPAAVATTFDRSGGFDNTTDLTLNGTSAFNALGRLIRLTEPFNDQTGTFYATNRLGMTSFTTTFTFQIFGGSSPRADGMAFIIQSNDPFAMGPGGGGLGYGPDQPGCCGILNSAAVKFDIYNNAGEGINSTGLFTEGRSPTVRLGTAPAIAPDRTDALNPAEIDLHSARVFEATIAYTGTRLQTTIRDTMTDIRASRSYNVNLSRFVGANTAWVGFGGATGGLNAVQDVRSWRFDALANPVLGPLAPSYLGMTAAGPTQNDLIWEDNSDDETGFRIERSADGITFAPLATVGANSTTFSDTSPLVGLNYYRVVAFNTGGDSPRSNTLRIDPDAVPVSFDRSGGFDNATGFTLNGNTAFNAPGRLLRLTEAFNDQRGTFYWTDRVPIRRFVTTFTFQIHGGSTPRADGMVFILQANSPTAMGVGGGDLAYGGMANSAAVKFDIYQNTTETINSTGLFTEGRSPFVRAGGLPAVVPDQSIALDPGVIDLHSARVFNVLVTYDGATLRVILRDSQTGASATQSYTVNLTRFVNANTAWVGFGGATGGLNAIQDVRSWRYEAKP